LALLSAHYRQPLEWSPQLIAQSKATLDRLYGRVKRYYMGLDDFDPDELPPPDEGVVAALADDLNTPLALSRLSEIRFDRQVASTAKFLGLLGMAGRWFRPEHFDARRIEGLISARDEAKRRRDFAEADRIRSELAEQGIALEDGAEGTTWRRA
jgi:cysteinyl-tRNA synthetase